MMKRVNYYKMKCDALENFYLWVDQGSSYRIAFEQSIYYGVQVEQELRDIWDIIQVITMAIRLKKCGEVVSTISKRLEKAIRKYDSIDINQYEFDEEELMEFKEDLKEAVEFLNADN